MIEFTLAGQASISLIVGSRSSSAKGHSSRVAFSVRVEVDENNRDDAGRAFQGPELRLPTFNPDGSGGWIGRKGHRAKG